MEAGLQAVGGNTALALLLVIATNLGGIFTMPVRAQPPSLNQTLHSVFAHLQPALQTALLSGLGYLKWLSHTTMQSSSGGSSSSGGNSSSSGICTAH